MKLNDLISQLQVMAKAINKENPEVKFFDTVMLEEAGIKEITDCGEAVDIMVMLE